jgi:beta-lactamase regulating signal transducer with metallopeptidase domain
MITAVMLRCLHRASPQARYLVCCVSLSVVLVQPLISSALQVPTSLPVLTVTTPLQVPRPSDSSIVPSDSLLLTLWAAWLLAHAWQISLAVIASQRTRARCSPFPHALERRLPHWTRVKQSGRLTKLVVSDDVRAAGVVGCGSPIIAVAPSLIEHLDADDLDRVVLHEWAHVQRRDDLANLSQVAVRALAGWHPAIWWLERRMHAERENACDEMALLQTGSAKGYAECLVKIAGLTSARRDAVPALGALSSASVVQRVRRIISGGSGIAPPWSRAAATVAGALLIALSLAVGSLRFVEAAAVSAQTESASSPAPSMPGQMAIELPAQIARVPVSRPGAGGPAPAPPTNAETSTPPAHTALEVTRPEETGDAVLARGVPLTPHEVAVSANASPPDALLPSAPIPIPAAERITPWAAAADAGVALGQRSKEGGQATAAFFTRLGKRVADSF